MQTKIIKGGGSISYISPESKVYLVSVRSEILASSSDASLENYSIETLIEYED